MKQKRIYKLLCFILLFVSMILFGIGHNFWSLYYVFIYKSSISSSIDAILIQVLVYFSYIILQIYLFWGFDKGVKRGLLACGIAGFILYYATQVYYNIKQVIEWKDMISCLYLLFGALFILSFSTILIGTFRGIKKKVLLVILLTIIIFWNIYALFNGIDILCSSRIFLSNEEWIWYISFWLRQIILHISEMFLLIAFILIVLRLKNAEIIRFESSEEHLLFLKKSYEKGDITQKEYEKERNKIIRRL